MIETASLDNGLSPAVSKGPKLVTLSSISSQMDKVTLAEAISNADLPDQQTLNGRGDESSILNQSHFDKDIDDSDFSAITENFGNILPDPPVKREICDKCLRPKVVCWCSALPVDLKMKSKLYILQHPSEERRCLRTARILELGCPKGHCFVVKGKKFGSNKQPELKELLKDKRTVLLFPSDKALPLESLPQHVPYNVVLIDGTWSQAKSMYHNSPELHNLIKVELNVGEPSTYVIRTQPNELCLSTVESAAKAIAHIEGDPSIYKALTKPLDALCSFQLEYGAVHHFSKEYLIVNGLYDKPVTRKIRKKMRKHGDKGETKVLL